MINCIILTIISDTENTEISKCFLVVRGGFQFSLFVSKQLEETRERHRREGIGIINWRVKEY